MRLMKFCAKWDMQRIADSKHNNMHNLTSEVSTMTVNAKEVLKNKFPDLKKTARTLVQ